ncbi:MAG: hypothetical protein ACOX0K_11705 [Oscillospiraceae bacterium]|jgi:hypothetical protein
MRLMIHKFLELFRELGPYPKLAIKLGAGMMLVFYIVGVISLLSAPYVPNYFNAITLYRGCMEAAPASFAAGVCGGLLGDLMLGRDKQNKDD